MELMEIYWKWKYIEMVGGKVVIVGLGFFP